MLGSRVTNPPQLDLVRSNLSPPPPLWSSGPYSGVRILGAGLTTISNFRFSGRSAEILQLNLGLEERARTIIEEVQGAFVYRRCFRSSRLASSVRLSFVHPFEGQPRLTLPGLALSIPVLMFARK